MRYRNSSKPTPRDMTVKYAGPCICCGAEIKAGDYATYYPAGTIGSRTTGAIGHIGGLEGTGTRCHAELRKRQDPGFVDLDRAYEDQCSDICGR